jgi:parallel beta-helix repeat protein
MKKRPIFSPILGAALLSAALFGAVLVGCPITGTGINPNEDAGGSDSGTSSSQKSYYIAPTGSDEAAGTKEAPFATLMKAQEAAQPGDTVYIRGGTYAVPADYCAETGNSGSTQFAYIFHFSKNGEEGKRISYLAYPEDAERPVFDFSEVKPEEKRVIAFHVAASYLHFKGFDITGVQVTITEHTQSECISNDDASNNIYENLSMHHGKAIGFYLHSGGDNLVLNCDAHDNYDDVSESGAGGNVDGFGFHPSKGNTGNMAIGCRAWFNSDDGYDLINAAEPVIFHHCWAFWNGYSDVDENGTFESHADGNGFKAGGWGMSSTDPNDFVDPIPSHTVRFCLAVNNKSGGFYANHHLAGNSWYNNTAYKNQNNFHMLNRVSIAEAVNVKGYNHILKNNVAYEGRAANITWIDYDTSTLETNTFAPTEGGEDLALSDSDFVSLDTALLTTARGADGSLPDIDLLKPAPGSALIDAGTDIGFPYNDAAPDLGYYETGTAAPDSSAAPVTVFLAGDSTVCDWNEASYADEQEVYQVPKAGWGQYLQTHLDPAKMTVRNDARSGSSSRSFSTTNNYRKWYQDIVSNLGKGDYLLVQFGHNDEKDTSFTGMPQGALESKDTAGSFKWYLYNKYILLARERGAHPVLVTAVSRLATDGQVNYDSHGLFDDAVRQLAAETGVPLIDLDLESAKYIMLLYAWQGRAATEALFSVTGAGGVDKTHFNTAGAQAMAALVAANFTPY